MLLSMLCLGKENKKKANKTRKKTPEWILGMLDLAAEPRPLEATLDCFKSKHRKRGALRSSVH